MKLKELCRTCLRRGKTMVSIFNLMQVPTMEHTELQIHEIIKIFTDVSLSPDDDLPDQICCDCLDKICRSYIFKLKLSKYEAIMKQIYVKVIKSMSSSNEYENDAEMHVDLIKIENTQHFEKSIDQLERTSSPEHCTTKADISIVQEVKQETEINIEEECEALCDTEDTSRNECSICLKLFTSKMALDEHIEIHTAEKEYQCEICPNKFNVKTNLTTHLEEDHGGEHFEKSIDQLERTSLPEHFTTKAEISIVQEVKQETEIEINIEEECEALCDTEETSKKNDRKRYKCELCLNKFRLKVNLMEHMLNDHNCGLPNDRKFECTICSKLYTTRHSVHIHMREVHREKPFQCEACPNKFLFRSNLWEHMRKDHPCEPLTVKSVRIKKIAKIKCEICSKLISKNHLKAHMNTVHAVGYQCEICLIEFQFKLDLRDHMIKEHDPSSSNNDIIKCSKCRRLFTNKRGLSTHMRTHIVKKVKCTTCSKVLNTKGTLYWHNRLVHGGFQCELCPKKFELKNTLREHLLKDHETYGCTLCSKVCIDKNALIEHMRFHSGEKPFQCEVCPNNFRTEHNLKNHMKSMHDVNSEDTEKSSKNGLKLKCEICSKLFINEHQLIEHMRIHSGEKPIQCKACPKKFRTLQCMKMHVKRMHNPKSEEKIFQCEICPSKYVRKNVLRRHMQKNHGPISSKNKCPICSKTFAFKTEMYRHIRIFHSSERLFPCKMCPNKFKFKADLRKHLSMDHGTSNQLNRTSLPKHSTIKTEISIVQEVKQEPEIDINIDGKCEALCDAEEKSRNECSICWKLFTSKMALDEHIEIHTEEKPHQCEICPNKFNEKTNLAKHLEEDHGGEHFEKSIDQLERTSLPEHSTTKAEISIVQEVKQEPEIEINIEGECKALCDAEETSRIECSICFKWFTSKMALDDHIEIHTEEKPHQCEIYPNKFHLKTNFEKHLREDHGDETSKKNDQERYKCELCLNKFRLEVNLLEHMQNDHSCGVPNDGKFECTICSKLFTSKHYVHIHMRKVHCEKPFQCEVCPIKFLFRYDLWAHMRKAHPCEPLIVKTVRRITKIVKIKCEICSKLISKNHLKSHMNTVHAVGYQCEICAIQFQFMLELRDHMIKEHDPRSSNNDILKCSKCPRLFINKKGLNKHMKTHLLEKVKCTTCLKVFNTKVTLYRHNRMVHRGFQCELCPKMFELKNNLRQHLLKDHETYNCTLCSKVCIDKNTFIEHLRTHSGEKTFQCEVCPNYFRTEHNLKNHVQSMHDVNSEDILIDTEKSSKNCLKLKCEICSKLFINENLFIEHLRIHSGEKPFQCTASPKKISNHEMYENAREKNA